MKENDIVKAIMKYLRTVPGYFAWKGAWRYVRTTGHFWNVVDRLIEKKCDRK